MPLTKCPRTGKLYNNDMGLVHPSAVADEEGDYERILDYVADHPNCSAVELVEATEVTRACVERMIQCGRLKEFTPEELKEQAIEQEERAAEVAKQKLRMSQAFSEAHKSLSERMAQADKRVGAVHSEIESKRRV